MLDSVFISRPWDYTAEIVVTDITDHFPVFLILKQVWGDVRRPDACEIKHRVINDTTVANMIHHLERYNFETLCNMSNCDSAIRELITIINDSFRRFCPLKVKKISYKRKTKPWIRDELLTYIRKRSAYYSLYTQGKIPEALYKNFRNFVTMQVREAKSKYFKELFIL